MYSGSALDIPKTRRNSCSIRTGIRTACSLCGVSSVSSVISRRLMRKAQVSWKKVISRVRTSVIAKPTTSAAASSMVGTSRFVLCMAVRECIPGPGPTA